MKLKVQEKSFKNCGKKVYNPTKLLNLTQFKKTAEKIVGKMIQKRFHCLVLSIVNTFKMENKNL